MAAKIFISRLLSRLNEPRSGPVYIQPHNFPDPDALGAAWGLAGLLEEFGHSPRIIYRGELQRNALQRMVKHLHLPAFQAEALELKEEDALILVDTLPFARNINPASKNILAVIDHHEGTPPESIDLIDHHPSAGSCCTLITHYYKQMNLEPRQEIATAMLIGLNRDTDMMTRSVTPEDIEAWAFLHQWANISLVQTILRNNIQSSDLPYFKEALNQLKIEGKAGFCFLPDGCSQELLGILGDFILSVDEVDFAALFARNQDKINVSFRSENSLWNASEVIKKVLEGWGSGGGHAVMAGGRISNPEQIKPEDLWKRLRKTLDLL